MPKISPHAVVDPKAVIADDVEIGPFCVVGPHVTIDAGTKLINAVTLSGKTRIGKNNLIYAGAVLGGPPQDRKHAGEVTELVVGDDNVIRECVTISAGSVHGGGITRLGSDNYLMAYAHIGHDGQFGSHCILANNVMIAGHVVCGDGVNMMGNAGVHHFVSIGEYSFIGGAARIHHDVPPYTKIDGADRVRGANKIGMRRAGFDNTDIRAVDGVVRDLFLRSKPMSLTMQEYEAKILNGVSPCVKNIVEFLKRRDQGRHGRYLESTRH